MALQRLAYLSCHKLSWIGVPFHLVHKACTVVSVLVFKMPQDFWFLLQPTNTDDAGYHFKQLRVFLLPLLC